MSTSCAFCGKSDVPLRKCGRCLRVKYCNRECQRTHWSTHRFFCAPDEPDHIVVEMGAASARVSSALRTFAASRDGYSSVNYDSSMGTVETIYMSGERNHDILKAFLEEHGDTTSEEQFHQNLDTCADAAAWAPRASTQEQFVERMTPEFQQLAQIVREVLQGRELDTLALSGGGSLCPGLEAFMRREFPGSNVEVHGPGGMSRRALASFSAGANNESETGARMRAYVSR